MTKQFKAEIIGVGTELLLGQIANTNAQWLSEKLALLGINVYKHVVVGDNLQRVEDAFRDAQIRSDIVIVTGGLGPTDDDLTREAFRNMSNLEMEEHIPSINKIESYFKKQKSAMTPNNRKQARVFKGCSVLDNKVGMAPGMIVLYEEKVWIFLPGVPREMKQLVTDSVLPFLGKHTGSEEIIKSLVLKFIGIGESQLEHEISDIIQAQSNPTIAPLAQNDGVVIRLTAKEKSEEKANALLVQTKQQIMERVGEHLFGIDEQTLGQQVISLLNKKKMKIAAAESLTGGMFMDKLISESGASSVSRGGIVCYDVKVKEEVLGVSSKTIRAHGTVSEECALEMANNVRKKLDSTIGISFTGVAGPEEVEGKSVGTVYIGVSTNDGYHNVQEFHFFGDRNTVRGRATLKGLEIIFKYLKTIK
ncbi:competence/damage-inducible protein A [Oceanobacillus bengalensis]|uniref:Putative competence-damage inducible protein n=1 Tax=Oceanobacillus bengalensis TaxID=1435466 RepID=A0A494Z488_9BACI|nr:competence/damage-inducible protein A [Oceanobacillus bengalensis]RKQ17309.1 competence/damage-inducible protein A [Oceanobacillus bengalensis]